MKKFFLFAAVAMLALVGCEKQNQSGIELKDVEGEALVKGQLIDYFNEPGVDAKAVAFANVRVYITIEAGEYVNDGKGNIIFNDTTDAEGRFEIPVLVGSKAMANAVLRSEDFSVAQENGRVIYYKHLEVNLPELNAGDVFDVTSLITPEKDDVLNGTVGTALLRGRVTYDAGYVKNGKVYEQKPEELANGAKVVATVKYFDESITRTFVSEVKNGEYSLNIPVEEDGNNYVLSVEQYKANYVEMKDNGEFAPAKEYFYSLAADLDGSLKVNNEEIKNLELVKGEPTSVDAKEYMTFNVKGSLKKQIEKGVEVKDKLDHYAVTTTPADYSFTVLVEYYDDSKTEIQESIVYEGNKPGDKGAFNIALTVPADWVYEQIKVSVYADKTIKLAAGEFKHYYNPLDEESKKYGKSIDDYITQKDLEGIYKGGKANVVKNVWANAKQEFFTLEMGDCVLKFEPESSAKVMGVALTSTDAGAVKCDGTGADYYTYSNQVVEIDGKKYAKGIGGIAW
jgi:hypothetical protein